MATKRKSRQLKDLPIDTTYYLRVLDWAADGGYSQNRRPSKNDRLEKFWTLHEDGFATHESIGLWLVADLVHPKIDGIDNVEFTLHRIWSGPAGGTLERRAAKLSGYFFLPEATLLSLLTTLSCGAEIYLECTGTRLFRRQAIVDHFEWSTANHPGILAELEDIAMAEKS